MKKYHKKFFNLIEITMAIAVVGIGISGILALFPPAIEANKSADYYNYTGNMVNTLAAYIETELQKDWSSFSGKIKEKPADNTEESKNYDYKYDGTSWSSKAVPNFPGLYAINDYVYGVLSEDESVRALIRVWKASSPDPLYYYPGNSPSDSSETVPTDGRIKVFIEVGWPAAAAQTDQTRQLFVYEFFRQDS